MRGWLLVMLAAGCGRLGFDRAPADLANGDGALPGSNGSGPPLPVDAHIASVCGRPATAPASLTVSGTTYTFTSVTDTTPVPSVAATLTDAMTGEVLAQTTSGADGSYALTFATGGVARPLQMTLDSSNFIETVATADSPVADAVSSAPGQPLVFGNAPSWSDGSMGSVYGSAGQTRDVTKGTLTFGVADCSGQGFDGATVTISPTPGHMIYLGADDAPSDRTTTLAAAPFAVGFNLAPGLNTISVSAPGFTFPDQTIKILAGVDHVAVGQPLE